MKVIMFPGQGSQQVGMGRDIADEHESAGNIFKVADEALGFSLSDLCFSGPEEELKLTYHTQPAILTTSMALYEVLKGNLPAPNFVAGHSLGEYSALVASGAISFSDAVTTVRKRGQFMDEAVPAGQGAMAAVLKGDRQTIDRICEEVSLEGETVQPANFNCPGQVVISGTKQGVDNAVQQLKAVGVKRIIPLVVSGPFHSELMKPAASKLAQVLEQITIQNASVPVVTNADARPVMLAEDIESSLVEQMFSPVLWEDSVQWMIQQGVDTFIEIGPGKVLTGLVKKINRDVNCHAVFDWNSLQETVSAVENDHKHA
jgi:[acyl-carrier-protein] S-malonyltransferase